MKIKLYQCGGQSRYTKYPLGLGFLKANCKGATIDIVRDRNDLRDCDLIGLSSNAWGLQEAVNILEKTNVPVIIGGQGTMWKGLSEYPFKHIIIGEGELSLQKIIDGIELPKVTNGEIVDNIDLLRYPEHGKSISKWIPIMTSRGCPFHCAFCSANEFWGKPRYHSAEYFIEEVEFLSSEYPKKSRLGIQDDLFVADIKRFSKIHMLWMKKGLNKRWKPRAFVRAKVFTSEMGKLMKEMGFDRIRFGAESGSDRVLKILKKGTTVADNQNTIDMANRIGLKISASFMYGIPGETEEDKKATLGFIKQNKGKVKVEGWYQFIPFPGTLLYDGQSPLEMDMSVSKAKRQ